MSRYRIRRVATGETFTVWAHSVGQAVRTLHPRGTAELVLVLSPGSIDDTPQLYTVHEWGPGLVRRSLVTFDAAVACQSLRDLWERGAPEPGPASVAMQRLLHGDGWRPGRVPPYYGGWRDHERP